jgi:hypothetical protein
LQSIHFMNVDSGILLHTRCNRYIVMTISTGIQGVISFTPDITMLPWNGS